MSCLELWLSSGVFCVNIEVVWMWLGLLVLMFVFKDDVYGYGFFWVVGIV